MNRRARWILLVAGAMSISLLAGAASADTATLKCNSSRDQIWVYDSLTTFNVDSKLKCGEDVEVIGRVQGYVKIRAQSGVEGYVPEDAVSGLPVYEPYRDAAHDVGLAAKQVQAREIAVAAANATALAPANLNYSEISPVSATNAVVPSSMTGEKKLPATISISPSTVLAEPNLSPASPAVTSTPASVAPKAVAPAARPALSSAVPPPERSAAAAAQPETPSPSAVSATSVGDSDHSLDGRLIRESGDLGCQSYFSAYGLTPSQTKWIAQNRDKVFSNVCPAPAPSKVDFVIIFTHDVDFFSATMPDLVHKSNGFSDFTPMTTIDTALVPESQADKARREYVWIFQFQKGTFDPASFSPHRQYQFSKMETNSLGSKAGLKTVEDAFRFVAAASR
ncbi:MAG: hypothetical protein WB987_07260 [Candidatus Acidiferrales bacterium]